MATISTDDANAIAALALKYGDTDAFVTIGKQAILGDWETLEAAKVPQNMLTLTHDALVSFATNLIDGAGRKEALEPSIRTANQLLAGIVARQPAADDAATAQDFADAIAAVTKICFAFKALRQLRPDLT